MSFQKTILCGEITVDPELRHNSSGLPCCSFRVKTVSVYTGHDGQLMETEEIHKVLAWRHEAERIAKTFKKGHIVIVEGQLATRKPRADLDLEVTEVIPISGGVRFLGGQQASATSPKNPPAKASAPGAGPMKPAPAPQAAAKPKAASPIKPAPAKPDKVPVDLSDSDDLPF